MESEKRVQSRRECDHDEPCKTLSAHVYLEQSVLEELKTIKRQLADMEIYLKVFKNIDGFFSTGKWAIFFILGLASLIGAATVIKTAIAAWLKG